MPHEIATIGGKPAMMYVGEPPWHGLGTRFAEPPRTAAEAMQAAGLDWRVAKQPVYVRCGEKYQTVPGHQATVREGKAKDAPCPLGVVGEGYEVLQNQEAFAFFDPIVGSKKVGYETAGALRDGRRVWILARVAGDMAVRGVDIVQRYLLLSNGHDGHTPLRIRFTPVRVVCQNTLSAALALGDDLLKSHHGKGMRRRVGQTQELVARILARYAGLAEQYERLAGCPLNGKGLEAYLERVFPQPEKQVRIDFRGGCGGEPLEMPRDKELRWAASRLFEIGRGNDEPKVRGTLWAAYNGVAQLVDHEWGSLDLLRSSEPAERRLERICFGGGERIKQRAFEAALEIAKN